MLYLLARITQHPFVVGTVFKMTPGKEHIVVYLPIVIHTYYLVVLGLDPYGMELAWITREVGKYPDEIEVEVGAIWRENGNGWWAAWIKDWSGYSPAVDSCLKPVDFCLKPVDLCLKPDGATGYGAYLGCWCGISNRVVEPDIWFQWGFHWPSPKFGRIIGTLFADAIYGIYIWACNFLETFAKIESTPKSSFIK